jgi:hypothetical protein
MDKSLDEVGFVLHDALNTLTLAFFVLFTDRRGLPRN